MLIAKGFFVAVALFVISAVLFYYRATHGMRGPISIDARFVYPFGQFLAGLGAGAFLVGTGLIWVCKILRVAVASRIPH
jgi:hypothetical protein